MSRDDYEAVAECSHIVKEYKDKFVELSNVDLEVQRIKKEINLKIGKMNDPLGEDFLSFQKELNTKNSQFHELVERKEKLTKELEELRENEKEMMGVIQQLPNKDAIMAKVMADAGIELNG